MNDMKDEFIDYDFKRQEMASDATLRDYFAAKAMQGFLSNPVETKNKEVTKELIVRISYQFADAMMEARIK